MRYNPAMTTPLTRTISIRLTERQFLALAKLSVRRKMERSLILRRAIRQYLATNKD